MKSEKMLDSNNILRSSCRKKIIRILSKRKNLHIMELVRTTNSTYNEVNRNLAILENENIIFQEKKGRRRLIQLNLENEKTQLLIKVLNILNESSI